MLTLQGDFDDELMNQIYTPLTSNSDQDDDDGEDDKELTIEDVVAMEGLDDDYGDDYDDEDEDEDDDDEEEDDKNADTVDMKSFLNSSPAGKNNVQDNIPDISIYRPEKPDLSDIPADAIVTEEDTKSLKRAHRKADKIIQYAADVRLIASFHYKKQNFHLVKLLEVSYTK